MKLDLSSCRCTCRHTDDGRRGSGDRRREESWKGAWARLPPVRAACPHRLKTTSVRREFRACAAEFALANSTIRPSPTDVEVLPPPWPGRHPLRSGRHPTHRAMPSHTKCARYREGGQKTGQLVCYLTRTTPVLTTAS